MLNVKVQRIHERGGGGDRFESTRRVRCRGWILDLVVEVDDTLDISDGGALVEGAGGLCGDGDGGSYHGSGGV